MDCLQPPLEEAPPGTWNCPMCPPSPFPLQPEATEREGSIVSTANTDIQGRTTVEPEVDIENDDGDGNLSDDSSDSDSDSDSDSISAVQIPTLKQRPKKRIKKPPKRRTEQPTPRPLKRIRLRSPVAHPLVVRLRIPGKGKGKEREDDPDRNIFEDLLSPADRDMSKTGIAESDRTRFEKSCVVAEVRLSYASAHAQSADSSLQEKLAPPPPSAPSINTPDTPIAGPSSRPLRSHTLQQLAIPPLFSPSSPVPSTPGAVPHTPSMTPLGFPTPPTTLRIRTIRFGQYDIHPWYDAPFPEEFSNIPDGRLWFCEFCLKYMKSGFAFNRHRVS